MIYDLIHKEGKVRDSDVWWIWENILRRTPTRRFLELREFLLTLHDGWVNSITLRRNDGSLPGREFEFSFFNSSVVASVDPKCDRYIRKGLEDRRICNMDWNPEWDEVSHVTKTEVLFRIYLFARGMEKGHVFAAVWLFHFAGTRMALPGFKWNRDLAQIENGDDYFRPSWRILFNNGSTAIKFIPDQFKVGVTLPVHTLGAGNFRIDVVHNNLNELYGLYSGFGSSVIINKSIPYNWLDKSVAPLTKVLNETTIECVLEFTGYPARTTILLTPSVDKSTPPYFGMKISGHIERKIKLRDFAYIGFNQTERGHLKAAVRVLREILSSQVFYDRLKNSSVLLDMIAEYNYDIKLETLVDWIYSSERKYSRIAFKKSEVSGGQIFAICLPEDNPDHCYFYISHDVATSDSQKMAMDIFGVFLSTIKHFFSYKLLDCLKEISWATSQVLKREKQTATTPKSSILKHGHNNPGHDHRSPQIPEPVPEYGHMNPESDHSSLPMPEPMPEYYTPNLQNKFEYDYHENIMKVVQKNVINIGRERNRFERETTPHCYGDEVHG